MYWVDNHNNQYRLNKSPSNRLTNLVEGIFLQDVVVLIGKFTVCVIISK